jgi:hypothetical protein
MFENWEGHFNPGHIQFIQPTTVGLFLLAFHLYFSLQFAPGSCDRKLTPKCSNLQPMPALTCSTGAQIQGRYDVTRNIHFLSESLSPRTAINPARLSVKSCVSPSHNAECR